MCNNLVGYDEYLIIVLPADDYLLVVHYGRILA